MFRTAILAAVAILAAPLAAKESLGVFGQWGAFRDAAGPRCYAIAMPRPSTRRKDQQPYATVATWPRRNLRGQVQFRLARSRGADARITLQVGAKRFQLIGGGAEAWAADRSMDAAIVAAMRSAGSMTVSAVDTGGRRFSSTYPLDGAASALDAATVACARR